MHKLRTWGTVTCYLLMNCATSLLCSYCRELRLGVVRRWCGLDNFTGVSFFFWLLMRLSRDCWRCALGHHKSVLVLLFLLLRWVALGSRHVGFVACRQSLWYYLSQEANCFTLIGRNRIHELNSQSLENSYLVIPSC